MPTLVIPSDVVKTLCGDPGYNLSRVGEPCTVAELVDALSKLDQNAPVKLIIGDSYLEPCAEVLIRQNGEVWVSDGVCVS